jgi:hypothetical protein
MAVDRHDGLHHGEIKAARADGNAVRTAADYRRVAAAAAF